MRLLLVIWLLLQCALNYSQAGGVRGRVADRGTGKVLAGASLGFAGKQWSGTTDGSGEFLVKNLLPGSYTLEIEAMHYRVIRIPIQLVDSVILQLGTISLELESEADSRDSFVSLGETELRGDGIGISGFGLLQANRDLFLRRVAFDWGQVFFRPRGYDSRNMRVLLNGFPLNSLYDGRPQWNHWGGLNDVLRNQEIFYGLSFSEYGCTELLGGVAIDTRPSGMRPGYRISGSLSNRTYSGRIMATYASRPSEGGFTFAVSGSRRWSREGYVRGTLYDAWSAYAGLQYELDQNHSLQFAAISASNRRGRSAAITEEVAQLLGRDYNPYWGLQNGNIRNARERLIREPIIQLLYRYHGQGTQLQLGMSYQFGSQENSRFGYYNAPNPDPVYYRNLPSYSVNNPSGANFINAGIAREALGIDPQLRWEDLFSVNLGPGRQGKAAYLVYDDVMENDLWSLQAQLNVKLWPGLQLDAGAFYRNLRSDNYSRIKDLLGAVYHEDLDAFSLTVNDVQGRLQKGEGDIFGYHYLTSATDLEGYLQLGYDHKNWKAGAIATFVQSKYQRTGIFVNDRFPDNSGGEGPSLEFKGFKLKGSLGYHLGSRHWWSFNAIHGHRPPLLKHLYINPRESHAVIPNLRTESLFGLEWNYWLRLPELTAKLSTFYSRIMHQTDIRFFFVDAGVGSDFVQEAVTGLDHLYLGAELGVEYNLTSNLKGSLVANLGKYQYASDPLVAINFDTAGPEEELIDPAGHVDLGPAAFHGNFLSSGPQMAFSVGLDYQSSSYWRLGINANFLNERYISPSVLARTASFSLDPETGLRFPEASPEQLQKILKQKPLEGVYLLNLTAGKSWLHKGVYLGLFLSLANLFDFHFRSGGYEQSRNGNYGQWVRDHQSGNPSFGPKYWYGYGRTYFLNLAVSF